MKIREAGDRAVIVEFGTTIEPKLVAQVQQLDHRLTAALAIANDGPLTGILETIPTFRSLAIVLDPLQTSPQEVAEAVMQLAEEGAATTQQSNRVWQLPVCYGGEFGPDLDDVAQRVGCSSDEVIERHLAVKVSVYLLGFLPGFAFMGDTDTRLHLPRRTEPRVRVPAGTVGLALTLTAIYPWESPGGWHLIGHSPVRLFDADRAPAALLAPGDTVSFQAVDQTEHAHLQDALASKQIDESHFLVDTT